MKKFIYLSTIAVMVFFVSCNDLKESIEVGFRTNIEAEIPVITQKAIKVDQKSANVANDVYSFIGVGAFSLNDIEELKKYIDKLRSIVAEDGSVITFTGTADGNKILTLKMKFGIQITPGTEPPMVTAFNNVTELTSGAGVITYIDNTWSPLLIGALEANRDKVFVITIEGTSNYMMNSPAKVKIPVKITASPLD
jgi:hypothetical protein